MSDEEELVGGLAFVEDVGTGIEAMVAGAAGEQLLLLGREAGEEGMLGDDVLKPVQLRLLLLRCREWRPPPP